jgi:hypothetical protein
MKKKLKTHPISHHFGALKEINCLPEYGAESVHNEHHLNWTKILMFGEHSALPLRND